MKEEAGDWRYSRNMKSRLTELCGNFDGLEVPSLEASGEGNVKTAMSIEVFILE